MRRRTSSASGWLPNRRFLCCLARAHAVVLYRIEKGWVYGYDPCCPRDRERFVKFDRPCTKITSDYKKRRFVQSQTTISSVRPRLLVQSPALSEVAVLAEVDGGDASGLSTSRSKPSQGLELATSVVDLLLAPTRQIFGAAQVNWDADADGHRRSPAPASFY